MSRSLVLALLVVGVLGCKREPIYATAAEVAGTYRPSKGGLSDILELDVDGRYRHVITQDGAKRVFEGHWKLLNDEPGAPGTTLVLFEFCFERSPSSSCQQNEFHDWYVPIEAHKGRLYLPIDSDVGLYYVKVAAPSAPR